MVGLAPSTNDPPPPGQVRTADLLAALSLASDLAIGLPAEHAVRSCYIGMHIADHLQLSSDQQVDVYYAELLMDAGCTAWTSQLAGFILSDEILVRRELFFHRNARDPIEMFGWLNVRHHLEHIYTKIGVGTRVAATLFAVEHDLLK